jgi:hypothetical protein
MYVYVRNAERFLWIQLHRVPAQPLLRLAETVHGPHYLSASLGYSTRIQIPDGSRATPLAIREA